MRMFIHFNHDEIQKEIPYRIIAETTSRSIWNTGRRKRLFANLFSKAERDMVSKIKAQAHSWALVKGVPKEGVAMTMSTYQLWHKLAEFCASL